MVAHRYVSRLIRFVWFASMFVCTALFAQEADESASRFRAGATAVDISPSKFPVRVAGGFLEGQANQLHDRLFARAIVLDDGATKIVMVVVDTCMMTQELIDEAKTLASQSTGIPTQHMMVSATHTHAAPAAMACLGTRQDKDYAESLPPKIAEAIVTAHEKLEVARIGWASIDDWEHTHNRRWIRKPENKIVDPFGNPTGLAHMHPGYLSASVIGPSGPVDPTLSVISLQRPDGRPLALFANYSQHYFGAPALSADYYGLFCKHIASLLGQTGDGNGPFVAAISQGTSGDLMWMDYGSAAKSINLPSYAEAVARYAEIALGKIEYHDSVPLAMVEKDLTLKYRVPDESRLAWARPIAAKIENELPKNIPEVYAMEATILDQRQQTNVKLQAIRIGDLTIATLPNEVYALTGLKLRGRSPSPAHFNIELANGAEGYIPPPEQHVLGGYTTWPARTAGLEVEAEPKIVDTLVGALEQVTGQPRRIMGDENGPYATRVLQAKPIAFWRLNDEDGLLARNAVMGEKPAQLHPGYALYLPGVGSGTGIGNREHLIASAFSGPHQINRAIHFAGGELSADLTDLKDFYSFTFWFWLGERSGASSRSGVLCIGPHGEQVVAKQSPDHSVQLEVGSFQSELKLQADQWNFAVVVRERNDFKVLINGATEPAIHATLDPPAAAPSKPVRFAVSLQGKLDEIAVFNRALTDAEVNEFWHVSGVADQNARELAARQRGLEAIKDRSKPLVLPESYPQTLASLKPIFQSPLTESATPLVASGSVKFDSTAYATLSSARLSGKFPELKAAYSVSMWFRNDLAANVRPVTAYLFSRGPNDDAKAPGDHLGIGGTYQRDLLGKLMFFNGNASNRVVAGRTNLTEQSWNHVVMIRDGDRVTVYLNGQTSPDIDAEIPSTTVGSPEVFFGARNDQFAPLQGGLAHLAVFDRVITPDEAAKLFVAANQSPEGSNPVSVTKGAVQANGPDSQPLSAEDSLLGIHVPRGYRVELVASEPEVIDPVAFDWDAKGRLWVVEMSDYPLGMDGQGKAGGRIRVLEDVDRDGRFERSQLFAEGLSFPNGILTWRDGVLVTAAPEILFLRDSDGDGTADQREVLFSGFNEGNQQLRMNHLRWGLDNWVYCANGGHHANHGTGTRVTSHRNGTSYQLGSRDFRFKPDTGELELESGPSQYGRNRDAFGHWFGTQNANPLWHYVLSDRYLGRNPHAASGSPLKHLVGPGSPPVYPASPLEKRYHSFNQSGRFTSACSSMIYGDRLLFGSDALAHAFTCEPFHNLVQHNLLTDRGISFQAHRPQGEGPYDFFASEDRWCRPVMVRTGPEGGLWIADMYRYMIEHPDWLPAEGKAELLPHYRLGDDRGRIYRILPAAGIVAPPASFATAESAELVAALESTNDWQRDKAHQMLVWGKDLSIVPLLEKLAKAGQYPQTRVQSLWVLEGLDALTDSVLIAALRDIHPRVRENAIRLAERRETPDIVEAAARLTNDVDPKVCLQLALSLGEWKSPRAGGALVELAERYVDEPFMIAAIMSSSLAHSHDFIQGIMTSNRGGASAFRVLLIRQSIDAKDKASLGLLIKNVLESEEKTRLRSLDAFLLSLQRTGTDLAELVQPGEENGLSPWVAKITQVLDSALRTAMSSDNPLGERVAAARLLCRSAEYRDRGVELLAKWLRPQVDSDLQAQIIETISQSSVESVPDILAGAWPEFSPALRSLAVDAWLSRETWSSDLLDRIQAKEIDLRSLDLSQRERALQHPSKAIAKRANEIFKLSVPSDRKQVIDQYRQALSLSGQAAKGQAVFVRACANCHRRGELGHEVGPSLATVIEHSNEKLLTNILDPNADVQPGFQAYTCLLDSGEIISGILASETASSLTIKQASGALRTVAREEIELLQNSNRSFMPEGLESLVTHQEMADLLEFLHQPLAKPR